MKHRKLILDDSILGPQIHADYYWSGEHLGSSDRLLLFIGGSIPEAKYRRRLNTSPDNLATVVFDQARGKGVDHSFLAFSTPPPGQHSPDKLPGAVLHHLLYELLPSTNRPRPKQLAFAGNAFGACLATHLACSLAPSRALVTFAGVGMTRAAMESNQIALDHLQFMVFSNRDDETAEEDLRFSRFLKGRGRDFPLVKRPGGHAFNDDLNNGSVGAGVSFALDALK